MAREKNRRKSAKTKTTEPQNTGFRTIYDRYQYGHAPPRSASNLAMMSGRPIFSILACKILFSRSKRINKRCGLDVQTVTSVSKRKECVSKPLRFSKHISNNAHANFYIYTPTPQGWGVPEKKGCWKSAVQGTQCPAQGS